MFKRFFQLEWKAFFRSASFQMNLILKIILAAVALFYSIAILFIGVAAYYGLKKAKLEPLETINHFLIYWWLFDLVVRYFLQKSPVMNVRPFLIMPLKKNKIVHYLLGKSAFSFFNLYPAFFFIPFSIALAINGYSIVGILAWHLAIFAIVLANNYLNLLINNKNWLFISLATAAIVLGLLQYYDYLDITQYTGPVFQSFYDVPAFGFSMLLFPVVLYGINFRLYKRALKLDEAIQVKQKEVRTEHYTWLDQYGVLGIFLKNDIRLIRRNKRSRSTILISLLFLFYGLLIFSNPSYDSPVWHLFAGIFVTGGFLFTFGGFVPSWDSAYYPLMMTQNIQYREYLLSKWWLVVFATIASMVIASFYLYLGWELYLAIIVGAIYNVGVNAYLVMLGGAFIKTPIDLSSGKKVFGDKQAFNVKTLLVSLPKLLLPLLIFYIFYRTFNVIAGYIAVALSGLLGLAFRNAMFRWIERIYKREKYSTLAAYQQKS